MTDEELKARFAETARATIASWKANRELPYLSPSACQVLADFVVADLMTAYNAGWQEGKAEQ